MWSSTGVAILLQGSTCCAPRDPFLYTLVVMSSYLCYYCLPIGSKHSNHSPMTSGNKEVFSPREPLLAGHFLFFRSFSVKRRDACVGKSVDQESPQILSPDHLALTTMLRSKSPFLLLIHKVHRVVLTVSTCLHICCSHVTC